MVRQAVHSLSVMAVVAQNLQSKRRFDGRNYLRPQIIRLLRFALPATHFGTVALQFASALWQSDFGDRLALLIFGPLLAANC